MSSMIAKLNIAVDESGSDQQALIFIVAVIITGDKQTALAELGEIEERSGKGMTKWSKAKLEFKINYIREIKKSERFKDSLFFELFPKKNYKQSTYDAIGRAVRQYTLNQEIGLFKTTVVIDGLSKQDKIKAGWELRNRGVVKAKIIRGSRDESSALLRLADAIAGLVRDRYEGKEDFISLANNLSRTHLNEL